jgi:hypothetical protein
VKSKKENKSISEILKWCGDQEDKTKDTIDAILDTQDVSDQKTKKVLTLASKILISIEELKKQTIELLTK